MFTEMMHLEQDFVDAADLVDEGLLPADDLRDLAIDLCGDNPNSWDWAGGD